MKEVGAILVNPWHQHLCGQHIILKELLGMTQARIIAVVLQGFRAASAAFMDFTASVHGGSGGVLQRAILQMLGLICWVTKIPI